MDFQDDNLSPGHLQVANRVFRNRGDNLGMDFHLYNLSTGHLQVANQWPLFRGHATPPALSPDDGGGRPPRQSGARLRAGTTCAEWPRRWGLIVGVWEPPRWAADSEQLKRRGP